MCGNTPLGIALGLSVVVPIGVIVAVAIVCIVVAVLSSAQRADVVAVDHEKQLFSRALTNYGERVLREVESVASSDGAIQNIRRSFNSDWANQRIGTWLETYFHHDYVFIFDRKDQLIYSLVGHRPAEMQMVFRSEPGYRPRASNICAAAIRTRMARFVSIK